MSIVQRFMGVVGCLALLASLLGLSAPTEAHPVTVDASGVEWAAVGPAPTEKQVGHIVRNALGQGQYAWSDARGDQRIVAGDRLPGETDLRQLRVTGTPAALYVFARFDRISALRGSRAVQLQLALRTDFANTSMNRRFVAPATTQPFVPAASGWNYLVQTRFDQAVVPVGALVANVQPLLYTSQAAAGSPVGAGSLSKADNSIELAIPWTALGGAGPLPQVRMSVAVLRSNGIAPDDAAAPSNLLDVVSPRDTLTELGDGALDYAIDVPFAATGEVASPLLITEFAPVITPINQPNNTTPDTKAQWVEITNTSGAAIPGAVLATYKVGDAANEDSTEGMFRLPNRDLAPGQSIVVARQRRNFVIKYPAAQFPGLDYGSGSGSDVGGNVYGVFNDGQFGNNVNLLAPYAPVNWLANTSAELGGPFQLPIQPDGGVGTYADQLVLLDGQDSLVDVVQYASPGSTLLYPGNAPLPVPGDKILPETDFQRCPAERDTNNGPVDFAQTTVKEQHTPGATCAFRDLFVGISGPTNVVASTQAPQTQVYVITYGSNRLPASGIVLTDTLPTAMTIKSIQSSDLNLTAPTSTTTGGRTTIVWNGVTDPGIGVTARITVTTELPINTPLGASSNDVSIGGTPSQPEAELLNNAASLPVAYVAEPTADIGVTKTIADASQLYPSGQIIYAVNVRNSGTLTATNVILSDTIPIGLVYVSNDAGLPATTSAGQVSFALGTLLADNQPHTLRVTFAVAAGAMPGATVQNQVAVSTTTVPESPTTNNTAQSEVATIGVKPLTSDVAIAKRVADASQAYPGGQIVYAIDYSNRGGLDADNVVIADTFPAALTYADNSFDPGGVSAQGQRVELSLGSLPAAQTITSTVLLTFTISAQATAGTVVQNSATIRTETEDAPLTNNSAVSPATTLGATPVVALAITKRVADATNFYPGGTIGYEITVTNNGTRAASSVSLLDTFPAALVYQSNSLGLPATPGTAQQETLALGSISAGQSKTLTLTFGVVAEATLGGQSVQNQAEATAMGESGPGARASASSETAAIGDIAELGVAAKVEDSKALYPGGQLVYSVTVRNDGTAPADGTSVDLAFPASLSVQQSAAANTQHVRLTIGSVPPKGTRTVLVTFAIGNGTPIGTVFQPTATVSTTSRELSAANNGANADALTLTRMRLLLPIVAR